MSDEILSADIGWESQVSAAARALHYPTTPDIAIRWSQARATDTSRRGSLRMALGGALLVALLCMGVMASPLRANVLEWLRMGAVWIQLGEERVELPSNPASAAELQQALWQTLSAVPLEQAAEEVSFDLQTPSLLPAPDRVSVEEYGGDVVTMLWLADDRQTPTALLQAIARESWALKMMPQIVEDVTVKGTPALWTTGPYWMLSGSGGEVERRMVVNHALIWQEGAVTWRLESALPLSEAVRVAESLEPVNTGRR